MSENTTVAETTADVVETVSSNKKALVAAGVTVLVAVAVGVALKVRARRNEETEVAVEETEPVRPTKAAKPKATPES
jgi:hypothetical protein